MDNDISADDIDYDELDPGIRKTVRLLRAAGFDTTDSGDGQSKFKNSDAGCAIDMPNVFIVVADKHRIALEADRLLMFLKSQGVNFDVADDDLEEDAFGPHVEASYHPIAGVGILALFNVDDDVLELAGIN